MNTTTDMVLRVWNDDQGVCLEIGPDADGLGIELRTGDDDASREWFGKHSVPLSTKEYAQAVGNALLKMAEHWPD